MCVSVKRYLFVYRFINIELNSQQHYNLCLNRSYLKTCVFSIDYVIAFLHLGVHAQNCENMALNRPEKRHLVQYENWKKTTECGLV